MPHLLVHQKTVYAEVLLHKDDFLNGNGMMPALTESTDRKA